MQRTSDQRVSRVPSLSVLVLGNGLVNERPEKVLVNMRNLGFCPTRGYAPISPITKDDINVFFLDLSIQLE